MSWRILPILPVLLTLLTSCATVGPARDRTPGAYPERTEPNATHPPADDATSDHLDGLTPVQRRLNAAYRDWNGTPYLYGGVNRIGVDCSAFTRIVYREYLQADLPRTTREQLASGRRIGRRYLEPGDLVFFRTARKTLHVGVMLDEHWFLHASTSEGVTVSSLQSPYWASVYIGARRMVGTPGTTRSTPQSGRNLIGGTRPS